MADLERTRKLGRRYGVVVLGVIATAFIVSSTWQIIEQCFGLGSGAAAPSDECARGIRSLASALDHAGAQAAREHDEESQTRAWETGLLPEWSLAPSVEAGCGRTAEGTRAFASLARLRHGYEESLRRRASDLGPLRQDLDALLAPR